MVADLGLVLVFKVRVSI